MLVRFDPFRELDRMFEQRPLTPRSIPMNAVRRGDTLVVSFDLPGVPADHVELTVERNQLTVTAERPFEKHEGDQWLVAERPTGRWTRQLMLGDNLDLERVEANYHDGVLEITIPVAEQAKPRKIEIGGAGGASNGTHPDAIEASSSAG